MPTPKNIFNEDLHRLHDDFLDSLDEELELELDDLRGPDAMVGQEIGRAHV